MHARAFDELAADYDATFTGTAVGRALRAMVWSRLDVSFRNCPRVLELGCGTGEDAVRLASQGTEVVAVDASPQMIRVARRKAHQYGCEDRVEFHCVPMEELGTSLDARSFDGVLSNFGAINCVQNLHRLIADLATRRGLTISYPTPSQASSLLWPAACADHYIGEAVRGG